jgi:cob(I)alamin adenosyltransferase
MNNEHGYNLGMMKRRTHSGDRGMTSILGKRNIPKHDLLLETLGTLDEASAALGVARSICISSENNQIIQIIQNDLFRIMAEVGSSPERIPKEKKLDGSRLEWLENAVVDTSKIIQLPRNFILPGDTASSAALSLARTIVRRAERRVVELAGRGTITNPNMLPYLNRLSTLCFHLELSEIDVAGKGAMLVKP